MITRIRTWWDTRSPWRIAARAQDRAARSAAQALDIDREFTAYVMWASGRIEELKTAVALESQAITEITSITTSLREANTDLLSQLTTTREERDSARSFAALVEAENARLVEQLTAARKELDRAILSTPDHRMTSLNDTLTAIDEVLGEWAA